MSLLRGLILVSAALLAGCAAPAPQLAASATKGSFQGTDIVTRREQFSLPAKVERVLIRNTHGDVRVRFADKPFVGVYATVQRLGAKPRDPQFATQVEGDRFVLSVLYPGERSVTPVTIPDHTQGRVDIGVWAPPGAFVDVETSDGLIQVRRAKAGVRARSLAGRIEVSTAAELDVHTDSGDIIARQETGNWNGVARVSNTSGKILVAVPVYGDVDLKVRTKGIITVDPGLPQPQTNADGSAELHSRFGEARRSMIVDSVNGNINVLPVIPMISPTDAPAHK